MPLVSSQFQCLNIMLYRTKENITKVELSNIVGHFPMLESELLSMYISGDGYILSLYPGLTEDEAEHLELVIVED